MIVPGRLNQDWIDELGGSSKMWQPHFCPKNEIEACVQATSGLFEQTDILFVGKDYENTFLCVCLCLISTIFDVFTIVTRNL